MLICLMGIFGLMASCSSSLDSEVQKNKEIVMKSFEVVANGDYEGMDAYISKPIKKDDLFAVILDVLLRTSLAHITHSHQHRCMVI